jgi:hypothetical protein
MVLDEFYSKKNRCLELRSSIKNNSHYGPCLNGSKYNDFYDKSNELDSCINIVKLAIKLKEQIIEEQNNLEVKKKYKSQSEEILNKKYNLMKVKFYQEENTQIKDNENTLKDLEEKNENDKKRKTNEIKELEKEIENLKDIINNINENKEWHIKKKKKKF